MESHRIDFPPPAERLAVAAGLFRAMADPTRLLLLLALRERERTVGELVEAAGKPQSTVSRHLAALRAASLVSTRRDGPRVRYRLVSSHVSDVLSEAWSHAEHLVAGIPHHTRED